MKKCYFIVLLMMFVSCSQKIPVDILVTNAKVYTVNDSEDVVSAFAIKDGKFLAIGDTENVTAQYESSRIINAHGKSIFPGLIDAHCHFLGMGLVEQKVRLEGTKSYKEVLERLIEFQNKHNLTYITGRGWDQNDWGVKEYPTKDKLDSLFPSTPIAIRRVDGHALLANQAAINLAGVTVDTPFSGGDILQEDGELTGVFIDKPMELILATIPQPSVNETAQAIKLAENKCLA